MHREFRLIDKYHIEKRAFITFAGSELKRNITPAAKNL